jgi:hypothetical protein
LIIVIILIGISVFYNKIIKRTPVTLLESNFDIELDYFDYSIETFKDEWNFNESCFLIIFKFEALTAKNIEYLKSKGLEPLPISKDKLPYVSGIPEHFSAIENGYYIGRFNSENIKDFVVFIVDVKAEKALLYHESLNL